MILQNYNSNDLLVRTSVAADAISKAGASFAKRLRYGHVTYSEQKSFELVASQLNAIRRGFKVLALPAFSKLIVTGDGGTNVSTTVTVNSITISNSFLYSTDNITTASNIAEAINSFTSTPNYTAIVLNDEVIIQAVTKGSAINNTVIALVGGDVTADVEFMNGGQDGVNEADNILTESEVTHMFNNIAKFTGCKYAPLGYKYE